VETCGDMWRPTPGILGNQDTVPARATEM
jgi:hypothetical protein